MNLVIVASRWNGFKGLGCASPAIEPVSESFRIRFVCSICYMLATLRMVFRFAALPLEANPIAAYELLNFGLPQVVVARLN